MELIIIILIAVEVVIVSTAIFVTWLSLTQQFTVPHPRWSRALGDGVWPQSPSKKL